MDASYCAVVRSGKLRRDGWASWVLVVVFNPFVDAVIRSYHLQLKQVKMKVQRLMHARPNSTSATLLSWPNSAKMGWIKNLLWVRRMTICSGYNLHELVSYNGLFPYVHSPSMRISKSELFMVLGRVIYSCNCGGCIAICHFSDMILQDKLLSLFESFYPFSLGHFVLLHDWFSKDIGEVEGHICCWGSAATVAFCLVGLSHVSPHDRLSKLNIVFHNMAWCHSRLSSGHGVYKPVWCGLGGKVSKLTPTDVVVRSTTRRIQARK